MGLFGSNKKMINCKILKICYFNTDYDMVFSPTESRGSNGTSRTSTVIRGNF